MVTTSSPERTEEVGAAWGAVLAAGDLLLLSGALGAGKTVLVRGIARGLGVDHGVRSPTFAIHLTYPGRLLLHHLDLYRVTDARDLDELGLDDLLREDGPVGAFAGDGVVVVEWGERLGAASPPWAVRVRFEEPTPGTRELHVTGAVGVVRRLLGGGR